eukprot:jgi/Tetstr1/459810/TSEL_005160.t1
MQLRHALAQERLLLGQAEDDFAEATALAQQATKAEKAKKDLLKEAEDVLRQKREALHSLCNTFLRNAVKFQQDCSFESFETAGSKLDTECKNMSNTISERYRSLHALQMQQQKLKDQDQYTELAASVESTKTAIATEATQTAAMMQKLELARNTYGSEAVKREKAALEERLDSLSSEITVSNERNSNLKTKLEKLVREGTSFQKRLEYKLKEISNLQRTIDSLWPASRANNRAHHPDGADCSRQDEAVCSSYPPAYGKRQENDDDAFWEDTDPSDNPQSAPGDNPAAYHVDEPPAPTLEEDDDSNDDDDDDDEIGSDSMIFLGIGGEGGFKEKNTERAVDPGSPPPPSTSSSISASPGASRAAGASPAATPSSGSAPDATQPMPSPPAAAAPPAPTYAGRTFSSISGPGASQRDHDGVPNGQEVPERPQPRPRGGNRGLALTSLDALARLHST